MANLDSAYDALLREIKATEQRLVNLKQALSLISGAADSEEVEDDDQEIVQLMQGIQIENMHPPLRAIETIFARLGRPLARAVLIKCLIYGRATLGTHNPVQAAGISISMNINKFSKLKEINGLVGPIKWPDSKWPRIEQGVIVGEMED